MREHLEAINHYEAVLMLRELVQENGAGLMQDFTRLTVFHMVGRMVGQQRALKKRTTSRT